MFGDFNKTFATTINRTLNESIAAVMTKNSTTCSSSSSNVQNINFNNIKADTGCTLSFTNISNNIDAKINLECIAKNTDKASIQNQLVQDFTARARAETSGITVGIGNEVISTAINDVTNVIKNTVDIQNIAESLMQQSGTQNISFNNVTASCPICCQTNTCSNNENCIITFNNIENSVAVDLISKLTSQNEQLQNIINTVSQKITGDSTSISKGLDFNFFLIIPIIIAIVIIGLVLFGGSMIDKVLSKIIPIALVVLLVLSVLYGIKKDFLTMGILIGLLVILTVFEFVSVKKGSISTSLQNIKSSISKK